jgi:hypothetical protein
MHEEFMKRHSIPNALSLQLLLSSRQPFVHLVNHLIRFGDIILSAVSYQFNSHSITLARSYASILLQLHLHVCCSATDPKRSLHNTRSTAPHWTLSNTNSTRPEDTIDVSA